MRFGGGGVRFARECGRAGLPCALPLLRRGGGHGRSGASAKPDAPGALDAPSLPALSADELSAPVRATWHLPGRAQAAVGSLSSPLGRFVSGIETVQGEEAFRTFLMELRA